MIDTPTFSDSQIKIPAGSTIQRVTPHGNSFISQIKPDALLNAEVIRQDLSGNPVLRTLVGDITVSTKINLPIGSDVVLKVLIGAPPPKETAGSSLPYNFQAKVVTINGSPPPQPPAFTAIQGSGSGPHSSLGYNIVTALSIDVSTAAKSQTQTQGTTSPATKNLPQSVLPSNAEAAIVRVSNGMVLDSVVVDPDPVRAVRYLPAGANANLKPADNIVLHVLSADIYEESGSNPPGAKNLSPPSFSSQEKNISAGSQQSLGNISGKFAAEPGPYRTTPPPPTILPGQQVNLPETAPDVPVETTQVTTNQKFVGTVIGTEKSGEIVLRTPVGILKLPAEITLPRGTILTLEVIRVTPSEQTAITEGTEDKISIKTLQSEQQTLLRELVTSAYGINQSVVTHLSSRIPAADKQFFAKLLWFLSGINSGDEKIWLGSNLAQQLQQEGKAELLSSLRGHFVNLGKLADAPDGNWNTLIFPFFDGKDLHSAVMFTRRYKKDGGKEKQDSARFVVELNLETTGEVQIDGFVKQTLSGKVLDIYVRSRKKLNTELQEGLREIFMESIEIMGINGSIQFQVVDRFPVLPSVGEPEIPEDDDTGFIIV